MLMPAKAMYVFSPTPYGTFRVFMYYFESKAEALNSIEANLFKTLAVWGNLDKEDDQWKMISYEFSKSLIPYFKERFGNRKHVEFNNL